MCSIIFKRPQTKQCAKVINRLSQRGYTNGSSTYVKIFNSLHYQYHFYLSGWQRSENFDNCIVLAESQRKRSIAIYC